MVDPKHESLRSRVKSMHTLFISDLHLDESRPDITAALIKLTRGSARDAQALYILGDLFEAWIGDDDSSALADEVAAALFALQATGVPLHFMQGNRDFLIGPRYAARCGMRLMAEFEVIDLYNQPTLLLHGDTLCTDDARYLQFRQQVRQPQWQESFLAQPITARQAFAAQARAQSRAHTQSMDSNIMDATLEGITAAFREHDVELMIHGHTHRPAIHSPLLIDDRYRQRIVLGDWHQQASVLRVDANAAELLGEPL